MKKYNYNIATLTDCTANSYYILGAILSDGWIRKSSKNSYSSSLGSKDKDWVVSIKNLFDSRIKIQEKKNFYYFSLNNKEIGEWLIKHNCVPNKSLTVRLPIVPRLYKADLIRGIFDGDGNLNIYSPPNKNNKVFSSYICSSSLMLLNDIKDCLIQDEIEGRIYLMKKKAHILNGKIIEPQNPHWRLTFNKSQTIKLLSFIYYDNHQLSLKRKFVSFLQMKEFLLIKILNKGNRFNKKCKIEWPSDIELVNLLNNNSYAFVSKLLKVSSPAIVEHLKARKLYKPRYKIIKVRP